MKVSSPYLDFLSNISDDGIIGFDKHHQVELTNPAFQAIFKRNLPVNTLDDLLSILCDKEGTPLIKLPDFKDSLFSDDQHLHRACYYTQEEKLVAMFYSCCRNDDGGILFNLRSFRSHIWTNSRINQVLASSRMNVWMLNLKTGEVIIEDNSQSLLELPDGYQMTLEKMASLFDPEEFEYYLNDFKSGWYQKSYQATYHLRTMKGNWVWAKLFSFSELDEQGEPVFVFGIMQDVTESKEQEIWLRSQKNELEKNHRLLTKAEKLTKLGHWTLHMPSGETTVSDQCHEIIGNHDKWDKNQLMQAINPNGINWPKEEMPTPGKYIYQVSENKWVETNVDPYIEEGTVFGTIQDISAEIHSKQVAINNEAKQKAIINTIPNPLYYTDLEGKIQMVNQSFSDFFGVSSEEIIGSQLDQLIRFKGDVDFEKADTTNQTKTAVDTEILIRDKPVPVTIYKNGFFNMDKRPMGTIGIIFDRSEEIRRNARIRLANKQLNLALQGANAGFFLYDIPNDVNYWDERSSEIFGYGREEQVGVIEDFFDKIHPEDKDKFKQQRSSNYEGLDRFDNHYRIIVNGQVKYINAQGSIERNDQGEPIKIIGIHFDETEKMLKQQQLEESEKKYRNIFERIKDGYLLVDLSGKVIDANPAAGSILGFKKLDSLLGSSIKKFMRKENNDLVKFRKTLFVEEDLENIRLNITNEKGHKIVVNFNASLGFREGRSIVEVTFRDVTKLVKTQKRILEATIQAEDRERKRIAQDLHDSVQQLLITSKMSFEAYYGKVSGSIDEEYMEKFQMGMKYLNEGLQESRSVSYQLMPSKVEEFGLIGELQSVISNLNVTSEIDFQLETQISSKLKLDYLTEISLFRIIQEATNNIIKYSKAEEATVTVEEVGVHLIVTIVDNGVGFDMDQLTEESQFGLSGIRNRAHSIGADLHMISKTGKGTKITVKLPLD